MTGKYICDKKTSDLLPEVFLFLERMGILSLNVHRRCVRSWAVSTLVFAEDVSGSMEYIIEDSILCVAD
jgi:hypothetical protein